MEKECKNLEFLQSEQWLHFQKIFGRKTFCIKRGCFLASIIEHKLPIVGKYFYLPKGPVASLGGEEFPISNFQFPNKSQALISNDKIKSGIQEMVKLAKKENVGWIRIEPKNEEVLQFIRENIIEKVVKSTNDIQPKEIFVIDISKSEEQLLSEMKAKTRYNINLAKKKDILVRVISNFQTGESKKYVEEFLRLTVDMAKRQGISSHPESYYQKMIESIPEGVLRIYAAEYDGKVIATNLVVFYGNNAIYLHGASGNEHRNLMAPFLLQWRAILDAKRLGCTRYDFGGINTIDKKNKWEGITNFKLGFSPETKSVVFPGTYDIIINPRKYAAYKGLQRAKRLLSRIRK
jgi:lipid II:glycine glycyltransferase (peptidoglycan interpeptide bridge formation enzyme)